MLTTAKGLHLAVSVRGLSVEASAGKDQVQRILSGIDLDIRKGEIVAAIGPSGSGKTTLGLALAGYTRPGMRISAGSVSYGDQDILARDAGRRRRLRSTAFAVVPQSAAAAFNPVHRLNRQVIERARLTAHLLAADADALCRALYDDLDLPDPDTIGERYPHEVSGGQLQRVAAAAALAGDASVIVFDEPTTALDVTTQVGVLHNFRNALQKRSVGALYISHDIAVVAQIASRIIVLRNGEIADQGMPASVLRRYDRSTGKPLARIASRVGNGLKTGTPLLALKRVSFRYAGSRHNALEDIGLEISAGEVVGLVGESGSGKSTIARLIAGLAAPLTGALEFRGMALAALAGRRPLALRQAIQIAFQSPDTALNPRHTVRKILARPMKLFGTQSGRERSDAINRLLGEVGLMAHMADRTPDMLSGGQKQRVNLARAIAADPQILICDEVTSALDEPLRHSIVELLCRLRDSTGLAVLFITHDLSTAAAFADRVIVLHHGRIVEVGPAREVLTTPRHSYTAELVRAVPRKELGWLDAAIAARRTAGRKTADLQRSAAQ